MSITVRFAPSPTGLLHVGNARVALFNRLFADRHGGRFILRLDDTDVERSREDYAAAIERDLAWLGIIWEHKVRQSERLTRYDVVMARLLAVERVYPCYETAEELERRRCLRRTCGQPPIYDRAALKLSVADRARLEAEGCRPHWRFRLDLHEMRWDDLVRGPCHYHGAHLSDPVLQRADGTYLYTLPSVVDDIDLAVTHVIRGEDHVTNTAVQSQLFQALEALPPAFAHLPLMSDASGQGLSKRLGSLSLDSFRQQGIEPMALASLLAAVGTGGSPQLKGTLAELAAGFTLEHCSRAAPRFDMTELWHMNARLLHETPLAVVRERLAAMGLGEVTEAFWSAVRANLDRLETAVVWWRVCTHPQTVRIEDADLCACAADLLPPEPWDETTWSVWTNAIRTATGRTGKALFHPLRLALTGRDHGPELKGLLLVIGRTRALIRLRGSDAGMLAR
ncbi:MAG: glutamyl-tRNA synthetase [Rhodospirillaceae bacterium]|nr:MAG: glutamyl-tRNA synthetase [Rhodospirillaceae bacterium]